MKPSASPNQVICDKIILPACPSYEADRQIFNRSVQRYPGGIVYCENNEDAACAIRFAIEHDLTVRVRSGGHNYEGFCTGDGVLTLDTSRLKSRKIYESSNTARIGGGVNNQELYEYVSKYGYPFPSGTCPTVSAAGLTQGGGWGHSARMFGLACDSLMEAELVDAKGNFIVANHRSHPDLFWALRGGGGGNFGVVTALKYRLPRKLFHVTYVDIRYAQVQDALIHRFLNVWQRWLSKGDVRFTPNSRIFNSAEEGRGIYLRGFFYGTQQETQHSIQAFLEIGHANASFRSVTFEEAARIDASFYPQSERFRFGGRFVRGNLSQDQIKSIPRLICDRANGATFASVALYALGGKVRDIAPSDTAFFYRDANYIIGIETVWEHPEAESDNLAWIFPRFQYLQSITAGSYINFPYLRTENYMQAYYGDHARRLSQVKKRYDPNDRFRFAQSIRPAFPSR